MKSILIVLVLATGVMVSAGCSSQLESSGSTATGKFAPPSGSMTPEQRKAAFEKAVPQQARPQQPKAPGQ